MRRALRSLLAFAALSLWLGSAAAFCVSDLAYEYVMRGEEPTSEWTLPCCAASSHVTPSAQKESPLDGRYGSAAGIAAPAFNEGRPVVAGDVASPLRRRSYCERSSRLLR
jgi:hypothetical protein